MKKIFGKFAELSERNINYCHHTSLSCTPIDLTNLENLMNVADVIVEKDLKTKYIEQLKEKEKK